MNELHYPSDLTEAQWQILKPFLRKRSYRGVPVVHDRRQVVNTICFVINRTGCQQVQ